MATLKDLFELANKNNLPPSTEIMFNIGGHWCSPNEVQLGVRDRGYSHGGKSLMVTPSAERVDTICKGKMISLFSELVEGMFEAKSE